MKQVHVYEMAVAIDRSIHLAGSDTALLLFHGLGGTPNELRFVAETVHVATGATVICPVTPGHCDTYDALKAIDGKAWEAFAVRQVDALIAEGKRPFVGGLSMGSLLAIHTALERPDFVEGLVLLAPTLRLTGWTIPIQAHLFNLIQHKWIGNLFDFPDLPPHGIKDEKIRAEVLAAMQGDDPSQAGAFITPGGAFWEHLQVMKRMRRRFGDVKTPTVIIHPRNDDIAHVNTAFRLARKFSGPTTVHVLDDSYHVITLDRQRDRVSAYVAEFIAATMRTRATGNLQA
jgi:carboxylesterase